MTEKSQNHQALIAENSALKRRIQELEQAELDCNRIKATLQQEQGLSESIINSMPGIFYLFDAQGKFLLWNRNFMIVSGYSHQEMRERHPADFFTGNERDLVQQRIQDTFVHGSANVEARFVSKNGTAVPYFLTGVRIEINGEPHLLGMGVDISERKRVEEALHRSEEAFRTIFDRAGDGILIADPVTKQFLQGNAAICSMLGYTRQEIETLGIHDIHPPDDLTHILDEFEKQAKGEKRIAEALPVLRKDGSIFYADVNSAPARIGGMEYIVGIFRDITDHKRTEEKFRQSEARFQELFEEAPVGYFEYDAEGLITHVNRTELAMLGYTLEEMVGRPAWEFIVEPEVARRLILAKLAGTVSPSRGFERTYRRKDGTTIVLLVQDRLNLDQRGNIVGLRCTIQDISERKRTEEELHHTLESLRKAFNTTIQVMVAAVETRDAYTAGHQARSADLARAIAAELGLPQQKIDGIRMAGSIHDIGKLSIPAEILSKPTKLSEIEFSLIKEHARIGSEMLKDVESPWPLAEIIHQHHERLDGSGYPRNLKGDEILIEARILTVADVVEAMASHRPYRASLGIDAALQEIEKNSGIHYDSAVAEACLSLFREKGFNLSGT